MEHFKEVETYKEASKELKPYIKEVLYQPKYGFAEKATNPQDALHYMDSLIPANFERLVSKKQIVSITFNLTLYQESDNKILRTWEVTINSDRSLVNGARQQRPHYSVTVLRNITPNAISGDNLEAPDKTEVVASLYLPQNYQEPKHFRTSKEDESRGLAPTVLWKFWSSSTSLKRAVEVTYVDELQESAESAAPTLRLPETFRTWSRQRKSYPGFRRAARPGV